MSNKTLDRREFIVAAGATAAVACLPVALALAAPAVGATMPRAVLEDWHVDDMWGVYPRPSEPIGYGPAARRRRAGRGYSPGGRAVSLRVSRASTVRG